jgi:hypothetical protein
MTRAKEGGLLLNAPIAHCTSEDLDFENVQLTQRSYKFAQDQPPAAQLPVERCQKQSSLACKNDPKLS